MQAVLGSGWIDAFGKRFPGHEEGVAFVRRDVLQQGRLSAGPREPMAVCQDGPGDGGQCGNAARLSRLATRERFERRGASQAAASIAVSGWTVNARRRRLG